MNAKMICQKGFCSETEKPFVDFDLLFQKSNIVEEFQRPISRNLRGGMYGV